MGTHGSEQPDISELVKQLNRLYFSAPERQFAIKAGETLKRRGDFNDRLYLVKSGRLTGTLSNEEGTRSESITFDRGHFIGIQSFFSRNHQMTSTFVAEVDSTLAWIDRETQVIELNGCTNLDEQFMPIVVEALMRRQLKLHEMAEKQEQVMMKMQEVERLASLGQLAAGVGHELNNALTVLAHGTKWIAGYASDQNAQKKDKLEVLFYETGLAEGRKLSSGETRQRAKLLREELNLDRSPAEALARTGIPRGQLKKLSSRKLNRNADLLYEQWELGATLKDMEFAVNHSRHVIGSIKNLGAKNSEREPGISLNDSVQGAIALTRSDHKHLTMVTEFGDLPHITANAGELVQVWTNLIRNACDALATAGTCDPTIHISTRRSGGWIMVVVRDNGPGIDPDLLPHIFKPNVTTRKQGLAFGLGLGLTISLRIVTAYHGDIDVDSCPGQTTFTVKLPVVQHNEQT